MFCVCGCLKKTRIASRSDFAIGHVKGQPLKFLPGHRARLQRKSSVTYIVENRGYKTPCWIWQLSIRGGGYGQQWDPRQRRNRPAHVLAYEATGKIIPTGMHLDHLCKQRQCINPNHVEPVTNAQNTQRGAKAKLTPEDIKQIHEMRRSGWELKPIADLFGIHDATASRIVRGLRWSEFKTASVP